MATALRLSLLVAAIGLSVAGLCQTVPSPPPGPVLVVPSPQPQPTILQAAVPENVAFRCERGGIVELFPWEVTESSVAGTSRSKVSLPAQRWHSIVPEKIKALQQRSDLPSGSIHIWVTPPATPAEATPQPRNDHLYETIRKGLEILPPPK